MERCRDRGKQKPLEKHCPRCERTLPTTAFGSNRAARDGRTSYCRQCHNTAGRENRERKWGSTREYHLRRRYGITSAEYDALVEAQGGVCALCRNRPPQHVDHDHVTGNLRGALCSGCNQGLGNSRDDPDALRAAAEYVEDHRRHERAAPRWRPLPQDAALRLVVPAPRSAVERRLAAVLARHGGSRRD